MITDELKAAAAATILNKMLMSSFFSICAIDRAASAIGRNPSCEEYEFLQTLHCIDFAKMPRELREKIPALVSVCLGIESVPQVFKPVEIGLKLDIQKATPRKGWLSRLRALKERA